MTVAELRLDSADRDAYVRVIARADEESLPVVALTVEGELVDSSVYESYRARYSLDVRSELNLADLERFVSSLEKFNGTRTGVVALDSLGRAYVSFGFEAVKPGRISFFLTQRSLERREVVLSGRFSVAGEDFLEILSRFSRFARELKASGNGRSEGGAEGAVPGV